MGETKHLSLLHRSPIPSCRRRSRPRATRTRRHKTASKMNMFGVSKSGGSNLFPGPLKNADAASAVTTTSSGRSLSAAATQEYSCEFGSSKYYALCGLGGILSCGITHTAVTPLDLVKCRLQVNKEKYKNTITGFKITYAEGGPKGMVLGWAPTAIGYSAQGLCKFGFYEVFKNIYSGILGEENSYLYRTQDNLLITVRSLNRGGDGIDPDFVVHGLGYFRHFRIQSRRARIEIVCASRLAIAPHSLERHNTGVVLAFVADHHDSCESVTGSQDSVLNRHRSNVLAALTDDELLVTARDLKHAGLGNHALVARMKPTVCIDGLRSFFCQLCHVVFAKHGVGQIPHHDVASTETDLTHVLLIRGFQIGR